MAAMKRQSKVLAIAFAMLVVSPAAVTTSAQSSEGSNKTRQRLATPQDPKGSSGSGQKGTQTTPAGDRLEPDETKRAPADVSEDMQANRREQMSEAESEVMPYYNNFFNSYRLGPEDVISIQG